jgi:CRP-like cAMP-binding protein
MSQSLAELLAHDASRRGRGPRPEQEATRTRRQTAQILGSVPLFRGYASRHLSALAKETEELVYAAGEHLVEEGQLGETLFVVLSGSAKVVRGGRVVGRVVPGDFFGELSAIDGGPRSASVIATTPMRTLRLFRHTLIRQLEREPALALRLLDGMAARLRQVGQTGR